MKTQNKFMKQQQLFVPVLYHCCRHCAPSVFLLLENLGCLPLVLDLEKGSHSSVVLILPHRNMLGAALEADQPPGGKQGKTDLDEYSQFLDGCILGGLKNNKS